MARCYRCRGWFTKSLWNFDVLKAEEQLANLIADSINPQLVPDIEVVNWRNLNVLAVTVYPSNTRPHHLAG